MKAEPEPDLFDEFIDGLDKAPTVVKAVFGAASAFGMAAAFVKHREAKQAASNARNAMEYAAVQESVASAAQQYASDKHAEAARHQQRADVAESRARKLAKETADSANKRIAQLKRTEAPLVLFGDCHIAATDGDCIRINLNWILKGVVDEAMFGGDIRERVIGVVAHEWYHYLDTERGQRRGHEEELAADRHAGKVLALLGESPEGFASLLRTFPESSTHPPGELREREMLAAYQKWKRV